MNVSDIPSDLMKEIRMRFESTPEVRTLRTSQQYAQRTGNFQQALETAQKIDGLFVIVLDQYIKQAESEVMTLDSETADIPQKDKDEMMEKIMVLFMACDIIDSATLDLNDILHRSKPDIDITMFSDIKQTADMARKKLEYLQKNGDYMEDLIWADKCDNMYMLMLNKAKSIIRKRKDSKNWGESMKRLKSGN